MVRQAALVALLAAAAGGGMVAPDSVRGILRGTCKVPETVVEKALPNGGKEKTVTVQDAVNLINQTCREPGETKLVDKVELKLIQGGAK